MITDEEVKRLAVGSGFEPEAVAQHATQIVAFDSVCDFARAIYQLGRQHQRESDAALREKLANDAYDFERPNAEVTRPDAPFAAGPATEGSEG